MKISCGSPALIILHCIINVRKNPAERPDLATLMAHPWLRGVEQVICLFCPHSTIYLDCSIHLKLAAVNYEATRLQFDELSLVYAKSFHPLNTLHILLKLSLQDTTDVARWVQEVIRLRHPV